MATTMVARQPTLGAGNTPHATSRGGGGIPLALAALVIAALWVGLLAAPNHPGDASAERRPALEATTSAGVLA